MLRVHEHFKSWQGTGLMSGVQQYFIRLAGCIQPCPLRPVCDEQEALAHSDYSDFDASTINNTTDWWHITGGEPLEQEEALLGEIPKWEKKKTHLQTSGLVRAVHSGLWDFITVSPKSKRILQTYGDELVLVNDPKWVTEEIAVSFEDSLYDFSTLYLQPLDVHGQFNWEDTLRMAKRLGKSWRISCQIHKSAGCP